MSVKGPFRSRAIGMTLIVTSPIAALLIYALVLWFFFSDVGFESAKIQDLRFYFDGLVFSILIPVGLFSWVRRVTRTGRSLMAPDGGELLARDHRPPVLYLRPFDEDSATVAGKPVGHRFGGISISQSSGERAAREELLAPYVGALGPFVAVGRPGDRAVPLGAARFYVSDDEWHATVERLVRQASLVIVRPERPWRRKWWRSSSSSTMRDSVC